MRDQDLTRRWLGTFPELTAFDAEHQAEMLAADPDLQGINSKKHLQSVVHSKEPSRSSRC